MAHDQLFATLQLRHAVDAKCAETSSGRGHAGGAAPWSRLEGVVGKRIDSTYEPGERSGAWIKHRTNMEQEFVIGGYIPGARAFDALLVGVYEK